GGAGLCCCAELCGFTTHNPARRHSLASRTLLNSPRTATSCDMSQLHNRTQSTRRYTRARSRGNANVALLRLVAPCALTYMLGVCASISRGAAVVLVRPPGVPASQSASSFVPPPFQQTNALQFIRSSSSTAALEASRHHHNNHRHHFYHRGTTTAVCGGWKNSNINKRAIELSSQSWFLRPKSPDLCGKLYLSSRRDQELAATNHGRRRRRRGESLQLSAAKTSVVGMGASSSSSQRSALTGDGDRSSSGTNGGGGGGYGAVAPSTSRLGAASSSSSACDEDPEDPARVTGHDERETTSVGVSTNDGVGSGGAFSNSNSLDHGDDDGGGGAHGAKAKNDGLTGQILSLAIPALVALSVDPLMSAVDTAYIGRLSADHPGGGEVGLGALALNTSIFTFSYYIFNFLATVPTPFVASARAKGDEDGAARLVGQLLTTALALGLTLMGILELFGPELLHILGATGINEDQALLFLRTRALSAPAVLMMSVGNGAFRGFLDTKTPLIIALGANAVNFVLDPILIFTFGMGLQGAAIATVAAEWSGAAAFLFLLARKDPTIRMRGVSLPRDQESWDEGGAVLTSSAAVFGRTVALQAALSTACAFAARAGSVSIAAHQVASQLYLLLAFASDSLAVAAQCLVADRLGGDMIKEAREVAGRLLLFSLAWGMALLVVFQVFGGLLPLIFTSNLEVLAAVAPVILVVGLLQPLNSFVFVGDGILQGTQDFVYEALTMAFSASLLPGYIWLHGYLGGGETTLLDVWVG
ncbi:unnamed protein product, partial [Pylaiella littoralis]